MVLSYRTVYVVDETPDEAGGSRSLLASMHWNVECYSSGKEFLDKFDPARCACLLLDLRTRDLPASEIQAELKARGVELPTIIVTRSADVRTAVDVMQRGAMDLLEKPVVRRELFERIEVALDRDRQRREQSAWRADFETRWATLTVSERSVVRLLLEGKSNREMGSQLGCGRRTIESRRANLMLKLGATSLAQLVRLVCCAGKDFDCPGCSNRAPGSN